ncbi:MAG TPA: EAL domain-containing protein [Clostridiales bacterium]|nr:EAL domain-containing protein [Clostridiales bacterium]
MEDTNKTASANQELQASDSAKSSAAKPTKKTAAKKPATKKRKTVNLRAIEMLYTPVFDVHINMAINYHTSLIINDPQLGVLQPYSFIPVAQKSNRIFELGKWAVEEGCDAILRCEKREADINCLIIDIAVKHLSRHYFAGQMLKIVESKGVSPEKICFNINESILERDKENVVKNIEQLREMGFLVSIDDFGVEYTSISHLGQYDVDYIGLNDSMLDNIKDDERAQNMLQGIIDFAKRIGVQTRMSGVDNEEMANLLKTMGIDQMYGKYYGSARKESQIRIS